MLTRYQRDNWAKWLRQPGIKQTEEVLIANLNYYSVKPEYGFCCLGVYCHFHPDIQLDPEESIQKNHEVPIDVQNPEAQEFSTNLNGYQFFLSDRNPRTAWIGADAFVHMNDELEWSFNRIANVVENLPTKD